MSRPLTAAVLTELSESLIRPVIFAEGEFSSGYQRFWSGLGTITWNSVQWEGAGDALKFTFPSETSDLRAEGYAIQITGVKTAYISLALNNLRRGLPLNCWLGFLDSDELVIADPMPLHPGNLDVAEIVPGAQQATITLHVESHLLRLTKTSGRRYTPEDQKLEYPNDKGFDHVYSLQNQNVIWGGTTIPMRTRIPEPPQHSSEGGI